MIGWSRSSANATDPSTLILVGRAAGTSRLELTDVDGVKESYLIVVQRDLEMLKNLISKTVPTATVEITPIGDSGHEASSSPGIPVPRRGPRHGQGSGTSRLA